MAKKGDQQAEEARLAGTIQDEGALADRPAVSLEGYRESDPQPTVAEYEPRPYSEALTDEHRQVLREAGQEPQEAGE